MSISEKNLTETRTTMKKLISVISLILTLAAALCSCAPNLLKNELEAPSSESNTDDFISSISSGTTSESASETAFGTEAVPSDATEESTDHYDDKTEIPAQDTESETQPPTSESESASKPSPEPDSVPNYYKVTNYADMKAIWLSQFDLNGVFTSGGKQRDKAEVERSLEVIFDSIRAYGFNTVIIQLRPYADSFYPSKYYPPSSYAVGAYENEFSYDPFGITVEIARKKGLSVHGWINPLRGMSDSQIKLVDDRFPIKQWYNNAELCEKYIVNYSGRWYLNPAYPQVRKVIVDGAHEALKKYELDGIHMDDYFYPTTDPSFDAAAYADYQAGGGEYDQIAFRRFCLNMLIKELYAKIKQENPSALFGISPAGDWNKAYDSQCADYVTWCSVEGFVDYICPQVYFGLEHQTFDFKKVAERWQSFIKTDSVSLIIGMTFGKAQSGNDPYAGTGKNEWAENKDILLRSLEFTKALQKCNGVSVFCYQYLRDPISGEENSATAAERENFIPLFKEITWQ